MNISYEVSFCAVTGVKLLTHRTSSTDDIPGVPSA